MERIPMTGDVCTFPQGDVAVKNPTEGTRGYWSPGGEPDSMTPVLVEFHNGHWYSLMALGKHR